MAATVGRLIVGVGLAFVTESDEGLGGSRSASAASLRWTRRQLARGRTVPVELTRTDRSDDDGAVEYAELSAGRLVLHRGIGSASRELHTFGSLATIRVVSCPRWPRRTAVFELRSTDGVWVRFSATARTLEVLACVLSFRGRPVPDGGTAPAG